MEPTLKELQRIKEELEKENRPDQRKLSALRYQMARLKAEKDHPTQQSSTDRELTEEEKELKKKKASNKKYRESKSKGSKRKHS